MISRAFRIVGFMLVAVAFMAANGKVAGSLDAMPDGVSAQTSTVDGEVMSVDPVCKTVTIQGGGSAVDLLIKDKTELFIDGVRVTDVSQIQQGYTSKTYFRANGDAARIVFSSRS